MPFEKKEKGPSVRDLIDDVAAKATPEERKRVTDLIAKAQRARFGESEFADITPAMAAIIFTAHNGHNRDWKPPATQKWARMMEKNLWKNTGATVAFYTDGLLADAQHRLGACALANYTWPVHVVFGMTSDAIGAVDRGTARHAWQMMEFNNISDGKRKQMVTLAWRGYMRGAGVNVGLEEELEIETFVRDNDEQLKQALEIGKAAAATSAKPIFKEEKAQCVAFILLRGGFPHEHLLAYLTDLEAGQSKEGESSPFFVAGQTLVKAQAAKEKRDRLTTTKELGVAVLAVQLSKQGVKAVTPKTFKDGIKGRLPDPTYIEPVAQAAE
jgi:hypothetical protein